MALGVAVGPFVLGVAVGVLVAWSYPKLKAHL